MIVSPPRHRLKPRRGNGPVPQHRVDGLVPFIFEAGAELGRLIGGRLATSPHLGLGGLQGRVSGNEITAIAKETNVSHCLFKV